MKATPRRRLSALQSALSHDRQRGLTTTTDVASGAPPQPSSNWSSIAEACALFRSGACTPTDLLEACFARIDATELTYNSLCCRPGGHQRWPRQQLPRNDGAKASHCLRWTASRWGSRTSTTQLAYAQLVGATRTGTVFRQRTARWLPGSSLRVQCWLGRRSLSNSHRVGCLTLSTATR